MAAAPDEFLPALRASQAERDAAAQRLQAAFAEHRLDDEEFDQRIRAALTAKTTGELDRLTADLPAAAPAGPVSATARPGRFAIALKSSITRSGRWSLPQRFSCLVYKGSGLLDLRAAELTAPVTTIRAIAYKSRTEIVLPPGIRVELGGTGVSLTGDSTAAVQPAANAPVVVVRGLAYKGTIEVTNRPPLR
jgi:DUF1707 SHOCT-like domain